MSESEMIDVGRLALRVEGQKWVAYYARSGTMKDAIWLAEIHMRFVQDDAAKQMFIRLMRDVVSKLLRDATGATPIWPTAPQPAPEHERTGSA